MKNRSLFFALIAVLLLTAGFFTGSAYQSGLLDQPIQKGYRSTVHNGFYANQKLIETKQPGILEFDVREGRCPVSAPVTSYTDWSGFIRMSRISRQDLSSSQQELMRAAQSFIANPLSGQEATEAITNIRSELFNDECSTYSVEVVTVHSQAVTLEGYQGRAFIAVIGDSEPRFSTVFYVLMQKDDQMILFSRVLADVDTVVRTQSEAFCEISLSDASLPSECITQSRDRLLINSFPDEVLQSRAIGLVTLFEPILN